MSQTLAVGGLDQHRGERRDEPAPRVVEVLVVHERKLGHERRIGRGYLWGCGAAFVGQRSSSGGCKIRGSISERTSPPSATAALGAVLGAVAQHPRRGPARSAPRCARMATMIRLVRGGLTAVACATVLAIVAAPASAGEPILHPATYPDMTTYSCRTDAIAIHPGQNINDFGAHQDLPERREGQRPGRRRHLRRRLDRRGLHHPLQAEHGRDHAERQARHPERLGPPSAPRRLARARRPDLRLRRGEDDREDAAGLRLQGRRDRRTGASTR